MGVAFMYRRRQARVTGATYWSRSMERFVPDHELEILITLGKRLAEEGVRPDEVTTLESRNVLSLLSGKLGMSRVWNSPNRGLLVRSCPIAPGIACPARSAS